MSERKRYTADEIRKVADQPAYCGDDCEVHLQPELVPMLRQAADAEEELAKVRARLEDVVKECKKQIPNCRLEDGKCNPSFSDYCGVRCHTEFKVHEAITAILRAAR